MSVNRRAMHDQVSAPAYLQGRLGHLYPAHYPTHTPHHIPGYPEHHSYGPLAPLAAIPYYNQVPTHQPPYSHQHSYNHIQSPHYPAQPLQSPYNPSLHPFQLQRSPSSHQQQAAASFFARSRVQTQTSKLQPLDRLPSEEEDEASPSFRTNFRSVLSKAPPPLPPGLLRRLEGGDSTSVGKVRVILRVASNGPTDEEKTRFFGMDKKKRQVTLLDPSINRGEIAMEDRKVGVAAPKMFAFDGVFGNDDSQEEVSAAALTDIIAAVINGNDGCLFCFGHANLGKTFTMVGSDQSARTVGVLPTAIAWLYRAIKERKQRTGARFSVRVSAVEISPGTEDLRDLLAKYASESDQSPGVYLRHLPSSSQGYALQNLSEVRASNLDKAAYYLDAALTERSQDDGGRGSHLLYTLYVYQYSVERNGKGGVVGGRSRLHLIDFGGCERTRLQGGGITLSGLGNVILGIFNGQKHLPCRESKVTQVLRECLGSLTCHAAMLAHVSPEPAHYSETLHTIQLASRVHRMRRKRIKTSAGGGGGGSSTSSDEQRRLSKLRSHDSSGKSGSSDFTSTTDPSSSEMSCDTVVFRGHSDGSGTDGEGVPLSMPRLGSAESLQSRGSRSTRRSGSKIMTNGTISPAGRASLSPQPRGQSSPRSPRLGGLPAIQEQPLPRMPLHGRVPGYRQEPVAPRSLASPAREVWVDGAPNAVSPGSRQYGYMDDFKANMISHWVEHQSSREEGQPLYLTQFKQADSDSGSEPPNGDTKAQVHTESPLDDVEEPLETHLDELLDSPNISDTAEAHLEALESVLVAPLDFPDYYSELLEAEVKRTKCAPPPPPRTTPTNKVEEKMSPRGEVEGSESPEPLKEPSSLDDIFLQCERMVNTLNRERKREARQPVTDMEDRVTNSCVEGQKVSGVSDPTHHPLRILSEENLTIVSTFVADVNDLESMEDEEECDPSKFSFFEVPEFTSRYDRPDDHYFETRLQELVKMTSAPSKREALNDNPGDGGGGDNKKDSEIVSQEENEIPNKSFSDPRFLRGNSSQTLSTFAQQDRSPVCDMHTDDRSPDSNLESPEPLPSPPEEPISPQKQFLLLSYSLRHPDGSSNPDLNVQVPTAKRSPGNGQSSSDQEDEIRLSLTTYTDTVNGNQSEQRDSLDGVNESKPTTSEIKPKKKESNNIAMRLLRLFGSTRKKNLNKIDERRSKSCDRDLEETQSKYKEVLHKDFRSASSSPLKRSDKQKKEKNKTNKEKSEKASKKDRKEGTGTPSTLSLAPTEWEFQLQQDEKNGNQGSNDTRLGYYEQRCNTNPSKQRQIYPPTSSLQELSIQRQTQDRKSSGYDSLEGESSSLDSSHDNTELLHSPNGNLHTPAEYAIPTDQKESGLQYDEVNQLKMEIKRHPNILRRDY